jgi:hypothetical protein
MFGYRGVTPSARTAWTFWAYPTVKPVTLVADTLRMSGAARSSSTPSLALVRPLSAEETGVIIGVEIDPAYVEVAIRRWQIQTGRDAVCAMTGETFQAALERRDAERAAAEPMAVVALTGDAASEEQADG